MLILKTIWPLEFVFFIHIKLHELKLFLSSVMHHQVLLVHNNGTNIFHRDICMNT